MKQAYYSNKMVATDYTPGVPIRIFSFQLLTRDIWYSMENLQYLAQVKAYFTVNPHIFFIIVWELQGREGKGWESQGYMMVHLL